jgi:hypothetical protein
MVRSRVDWPGSGSVRVLTVGHWGGGTGTRIRNDTHDEGTHADEDCGQRSGDPLQWEFLLTLEGLLCTFEHHLGENSALYLHQLSTHGALCTEWLPYFQWNSLTLLSADGDRRVMSTDFPRWIRFKDAVGDTLSWTWMRNGVIMVRPTRSVLRYTTGHLRQLEMLVQVLVEHFPAILRRHHAQGQLRVSFEDEPQPVEVHLSNDPCPPPREQDPRPMQDSAHSTTPDHTTSDWDRSNGVTNWLSSHAPSCGYSLVGNAHYETQSTATPESSRDKGPYQTAHRAVEQGTFVA